MSAQHPQWNTVRVTILIDGDTTTVSGADGTSLWELHPGDALFHHEATPIAFDFTAPTTILSFVALIDDTTQSQSAVPVGYATPVIASPLMSGVIGYGLALLLEQKPVVGSAARAVDRLIRVMGREVLLQARGLAHVPIAPTTRDRAEEAIERHASDPGCTPSLIADTLSISLRQLQRAYRASGDTVQQSIRRARVEKALALLRDPSRQSLTVAEIARHCGFSGGSALARAMSALGCEAPLEVRRGLAAPSRDGTPHRPG
ncbi:MULTISPECIES: AraC family transcriptional regulator [unclassified Pseudoclavibacter]|uniref:AraC family transcriptional regulator n=1 Tax=unclassified Pseudoclavibacter TaxID=2615177 RepID=UPI001BA998B0|nr:AraC family transcriptional regulator [Pseudoclavibacter sp. Marseille-Q4354]MBS3180168.1 helix-turn-helix transcriptional regulator [Pseudoclavibacter sp. Marseille-Q4354]